MSKHLFQLGVLYGTEEPLSRQASAPWEALDVLKENVEELAGEDFSELEVRVLGKDMRWHTASWRTEQDKDWTDFNVQLKDLFTFEEV